MSNDEKLRDYLKRVTVDLHDTRSRLDELEDQAREPIAIVGMSCRFPGGVASPEQLWELVSGGRDGIGEFPTDRGWDLQALFDPDPDQPGTTYVREGGFLQDGADFDAEFFAISPREALAMDPQQRCLLEAAWEALEDAGLDARSLAGSPTGVFVGGASNGYASGAAGSASDELDGHYGSGTLTSIMSGRISYALGLEGPALTIDTACSSSLVALHVACSSLRASETSLALVAGVNIMPSPIVFVELARQRGLAPDGRCKPYADSADGTGWSEGVGVLVLERLSEARRRGRRVLATVRGSAVNQDGASNGLTAPNGPSQQRVIRAALANAGLTSGDVDVVEGHGTGTVLGDPIEAQALLATYGQGRAHDRPLWLGSVKSNIGHTQAAAGVAGVIKMVKAFEHQLLPQTLHVDRPSQQVNWEAGEVSLLVDEVAWPRADAPRRAGVSSFGASGTNAHVILEEPLSELERDRQAEGGNDPKLGLLGDGMAPVLVSARTPDGLREQAEKLHGWVSARAEIGLDDVGLGSVRRSAFECRGVAVAAEREELLASLQALAVAREDAHVAGGLVGPEGPGAVVFVFPGQGSQWAGMAVELMERSNFFAWQLRACAEALAPFIDWSVEEVLRGSEGAPGLERIDVVQPALFAVMVALARLWQECGVSPAAVVGHSQGEIAAAHIAGVLSLREAARIVALRSQMLTEMVGHGGVVSLALGVEQVRERLARWDGRLVVSGVNGPRSVAVAGDGEALGELLAACAEDGVRAREIRATVATHSAHVEGFHDAVLQSFSALAPAAADIPFYSTVTGGQLSGAELDAHYWYRNLREPVEFERATRALLADGCRTFLEISPHPVLSVGLHETVEDAGQAQVGIGVHGTLRRDDGGPRRMLMSLGELWARGVEVDWEAIFGDTDAEAAQLPSYAFQRRRYWLDAPSSSGDLSSVGQRAIAHPLLGAALELSENEGWVCSGRVSLQEHPWFADHMVDGLVLVPGTTFVELALCAGAQVSCELLQDLVFETPLVLAEGRAMELQVRLSAPQEDAAREIALFSRRQDRAEEGEWTRHARGVLAPTARPGAGASLQEQIEAFADASWPPAGAQSVTVEDLYGYFAGVGLEYGPTFLSVQAAWRRGEEAFAEVRLPETQGAAAARFGVHPALLDCALQTGGVLMRSVNEATPENAMLPFAWDSVRLYRSGASALRVRLAQQPEGGMSVLATDEHSRPVLSAKSVVTRRIAPEQLRRLHGERDSLFQLRWDGAPVQGSSTAAPVRVAVLGEDTTGELEQLARSASADGEEPSVHQRLDDLLAEIEQGTAAPEAVLVRGGLDAGEHPSEAPPAATRRLLEGALSLLQQWIVREELAASRLVFVTSDAVAATAEEDVRDLAAASLWGLVRSAQSENPGRLCLLDVEDVDLSAVALRRVLTGEEPQVAFRAGEPLFARLGPIAENAPGEPPASIGLTPSGRPGTVLITGGTGALGSLLARHLVERHGVRSLLLASRRGVEAPGAQALREQLTELGAEVEISACEVSDREQLAQLIDSVPSEYPLSSVVHAAGALDDGVIASMTPARLDRVLAPKLDAAWHLHQLTEPLELSSFVLFSSSTGTIGGPAQSGYAAANAFLDALSRHRRHSGLPSTSMAWGWWGDTDGMAGDLTAADRARMERSGMLALSPEEGLALFDAAYAVDLPALMPARLDLGGLRSQARTGIVPPLWRGLVRTTQSGSGEPGGSLARRLARAPEQERARVALEFVRSEVASVLGHDDPGAIDVQRAFNELGFDSLTAIELRNRLSGACGVQLPATLAFDYPSTAALSEFLVGQVSGEMPELLDTAASEFEVRDALASISLARLREAGVLDTLLELAGLPAESPDAPGSEVEADAEWAIDELDLAGLVEMTLGGEGRAEESMEEMA